MKPHRPEPCGSNAALRRRDAALRPLQAQLERAKLRRDKVALHDLEKQIRAIHARH